MTQSNATVPRTQGEALARVARGLGGTWDATRAVAALEAAGYGWRDRRAAEKAARAALRRLRDEGLLVQTRVRPVEYRLS